MSSTEPAASGAVAVIGLACRFPGAASTERFWQNLAGGVESITTFSAAELAASGIDPEQSGQPGYVSAKAVLEDAELFDAAYFGIGPREAALTDPQQRLFLECAWEALEDAGCDPARSSAPIGVFAGVGFSTYLLSHLLANPGADAAADALELRLGNDRDFLATMVSYRLNLHGPSLGVATACSTSLVAVHLACQSLLDGECQVALAGGAAVSFPQKRGYLYRAGGILSADGHCRAFDARASGSVAGEGVGVVVLKPLAAALAAGDCIRAVIRGSAVNNDGARKIGFTAPSVEGQAAVIAEAHAVAGVDPATITYVEAHGSGTPLGDPVEVRALTRAFRAATDRQGFCALGSVKTNLGHLDAAAGVAGLIKTVLCLEHRALPATLHFRAAQPQLELAGSPFYVNAELQEWNGDGAPRRAGVSSFGIGGTNAHLVLEEAPEPRPGGGSRRWQLLVLSAATPAALEAATDQLAAHLRRHPEQPLADVAYTLQAGRRAHRCRRFLLAAAPADAAAALAARDPQRLHTSLETLPDRPVAFLLSGVGDHYPGMAAGLYRDEPVFRRHFDASADLLAPLLGADLRDLLLVAPEEPAAAAPGGTDLRRMLGRAAPPRPRTGAATEAATLVQPAVFALELALAALWRSWGVRPTALLGYSLGEYAAACLAGVFAEADGLRLVARRARLLERLPAGAMVAVALPAAQARELLSGSLALAVASAPELSVIAGPETAIAALEALLARRRIVHRRLPGSRALHSPMMAPAAPALAALLGEIELRPPRLPYVGNVTGAWVTAEEATSPAHWCRQLCETVRFAAGLETLERGSTAVLLEVGPGHGLAALARQSAGGESREARQAEREVLASLRPAYEAQDDDAFLLTSLGKLWLAGVEIDWPGGHAGEERRKLPLPTYPFQRHRFGLDLLAAVTRSGPPPATLATPAAAAAAPASPPPSARRAGLRNPFVAPRRPLEAAIAQLWGELLHVEEVGLHDSFFELGGHSLLAPRLLDRLRERLGVELPLPLLLARPTVAATAAAVEGFRAGGSWEGLAEAPPDLRREAALDPEIRPRPARPAAATAAADPAAVLLTGATGFLGAFLLRELLRRTRAQVHCLVRAESPAAGAARIRANLAARRLWDDVLAARIVAVPGDLAAPRWGLDERAFGALAAAVEAVYHCGAWVNFTYPYRALAPANVGGTAEALRLASAGRASPCHFVSTIAVFAPGSFDAAGVGWEDAGLDAPEGLASGYAESKWVAEKLVGIARRRGLPAAIYRPGVIGGDSRTGIGSTRDLVWNFLKACVELGAAPEMAAPFDPLPVDHLARAIVDLSLRDDSLDRAFHLFNPGPLAWSEVFATVRSFGYDLATLPFPAWRERLAAALAAGADNALRPFWPLLRDAGAEPGREAESALASRFRFDGRNVRQGLGAALHACPPVARLLERELAHLGASGFLPAPAAPQRALPPAARPRRLPGDPP